jgi:hypothetical protein
MIHAQHIRFFGGTKPLCASQSLKVDAVMPSVCMCLVRLTPCVWQRQLPLRCGSRDVGGSGQLLCRLCHLQRFHSLLPDPGYGVVTFSFVIALCAVVYDVTWQGDSALSLLQPTLRNPRLPSAAPAGFPLVTCDPHFSCMCALWSCAARSHVVVGWGHVQVACEGRTGRSWPVSQAWVGPTPLHLALSAPCL